MSANSKIEWTDATWTPIRARRLDTGKVGVHCEKVSTGCANCYSETFNRRTLPSQGTGLDFTKANRAKVETFIDEKILVQPLRWRKAKRIFVCSQTDLFGEWVTDEQIDRVFAVMAMASRHTFQVLTKRAERMRDYLSDSSKHERWTAVSRQQRARWTPWSGGWCEDWFPRHAQHIWLGVSVENPKHLSRLDDLRATPAARRFASFEPLLEDLGSLSRWLPFGDMEKAVSAAAETLCIPKTEARVFVDEQARKRGGLDWAIVGGESGPKARPCDVAWIRSTVRQCREAGVPVFVKQLGAQPVHACPSCGARRRPTQCRMWSSRPQRDGGHDETGTLPLFLRDRKGGDMAEWPEDLRVQQFPEARK